MIDRWMVRCSDCCSAWMIDTSPDGELRCPCEGKVKIVGQVQPDDRVTRTVERPVCDARCTGATGWRCDCSCGGANHGSGRVVTVEQVVADGRRLLTLAPTGKEREQAIARGREYRAAVQAVREALIACDPHAWETYRARGRIPADAYWRIQTVADRLWRIRQYRTHKRRMRELAELLEELRAARVRTSA